MGSLKQLVAITAVNLKTIPQRLGSSSVAVIGIAGVVIVFVAVLSIAEGFQKTMQGTGSPSKALIMRAGADTELSSILMRDTVNIVKQAPGIAPGSTGPMASAELFVIVDLPKKSTGTPANVPIRGVQPEAVATRDALRVVEGRMFEFGRNEVIVGRAAQGQFAGLEVGSELAAGGNAWRVVARSRPADRSPSRRSGSTLRCCSRPTGAGTPTSRSWHGSSQRRRSTHSRTR